jgi:hypothetical protein
MRQENLLRRRRLAAAPGDRPDFFHTANPTPVDAACPAVVNPDETVWPPAADSRGDLTMRHILAFAAVLLLPSLAIAQTPPAAPVAATAAESPFAVPVETQQLGKAKVKMREQGFSVGEYVFASYVASTSRGVPIYPMGIEMSYRVTTTWRFLKNDMSEITSGECFIDTALKSGTAMVTAATVSSDTYACNFANKAPQAYKLTVTVPPFKAQKVGFISFEKDDPAMYKVMKGNMVYDGVAYEAIPTGFDHRRLSTRQALGFRILRDGKPIGQIDFVGSSRNKGTLTFPVAAADGREAVVFFAAHVMGMPDLNSPDMRGTMFDN